MRPCVASAKRPERLQNRCKSTTTGGATDEIHKSGSNTLAEVIRNLPANTAASYDETFTGSFARGSAGVSLRGLGQKSTLTLINGRRMAVFSFAQNLQDNFVDFNRHGGDACIGDSPLGGVGVSIAW